VKVARQGMEQTFQRSVPTPLLKVPVTGLIGRIAIREIRPLRPGPKNPQHPVEHVPRIAARPPASILASARSRNQRGDQLPLEIGEIQRDVPTGGWLRRTGSRGQARPV
jgi:hypothetical protein